MLSVITHIYRLTLRLRGYKSISAPKDYSSNNWRIMKARLKYAHERALEETTLGAIAAIQRQLDRELRSHGLTSTEEL